MSARCQMSGGVFPMRIENELIVHCDVHGEVGRLFHVHLKNSTQQANDVREVFAHHLGEVSGQVDAEAWVRGQLADLEARDGVEELEIRRRQREHIDSLILSATRAIETARNEAVALGGNENMAEALRCAAELTRLAGRLD